MQANHRSLFSAWAGMLWCSAIVVMYYVSHKPFTPDSLAASSQEIPTFLVGLLLLGVLAISPYLVTVLARRRIWLILPGLGLLTFIGLGIAGRVGWLEPSSWTVSGQSLLALCAALVIVSLAGGIGLSLVPKPSQNPLAALSIQAALGLGLMALGLLAVGSTLELSPDVIWAVSGILLALLWTPIRNWWRQWGELVAVWQASGQFERWCGGILTALIGLSLPIALAPPVKFDALMYHLVMPNAYLNQGQIGYLPWIVMSGMPQNAEMLYTWAIALSGDPAATALGWCFAVLAVCGLFGLIQMRLGLRPAFAGIAALLCGYTLAAAPAWGYIDWLALYFGAAALICLDDFQHSNRKLALALGAVFAGMALGTKYPAGVFGLAGFISLGWGAWRRRARFWPALWRFAVFAGLAALPWFVKNLFSTGNPFYPFFFAGGEMSAIRQSVYQSTPTWGNWLDFFLLPLRATYLGLEGRAGYSVSVGPLLLGFGALAWLGQKERTAKQRLSVQHAALIGVVGLLVWAVGNRMSGFLIQTRFYFVLFPAFSFLAAAGFQGLSQIQIPQVRTARLLAALTLLPLVLNLIESGLTTLQSGALPTIAGLRTKDEYLGDALGWYLPATEAIHQLPAGAKTMLLYETRSLYCLPACSPDEILDRWKRSKIQYQTSQAILSAWKREGFSHILFYRSGAKFMAENGDINLPPAEYAEMDRFLSSLPKPVSFGGVYELYTIP